MRTNSRLVVVLAVVVVGITLAAAAGGRWVRLGDRAVNDRLDHDTIAVAASAGQLEAIKIAVRKRLVHFLDVKVYFANGGTQDVSIRAVIPAGGETRAIDLTGDDRVVESVEFWYEAQSVRRHRGARVILFGRR